MIERWGFNFPTLMENHAHVYSATLTYKAKPLTDISSISSCAWQRPHSKVVADMNDRYPEEAAEQRARRLIDAQPQLSPGRVDLRIPAMIPVIGHALKILGFVGGTAAWCVPTCT